MPSPPDTKDQILDAAERLLAENGYSATSLRMITAAAGVNLAAVNYHFGSKEALARAVFRRRLSPVNAARLARLDQLPADHDLEDVLRAFFEPVFEEIGRLGARADAVKQLVGRIFAERPEFLRELMLETFGELFERFLAALGSKLPHLTEEELAWRFHFVIGAMTHTMCHGSDLVALTDGRCGAPEPAAMLERLIAYSTAGLQAPMPAPTSTGGPS